MGDQAIKYGGARKIKSSGHQNAHPMCNAYPTIKVSRAYHDGGSLEALNKGERVAILYQASTENL